MGWIRRHWKAVLACAVLFVLGAGMAGAGGSGTKTVIKQVASPTETVTVTSPPETVVSTVTKVKRVVVKPKPKPRPQPSGHSYSGSGGTTIQVIVSRSGSVRWTNDGDIFQTWPKDMTSNDFFINSQAHAGTIFVAAGRYTLTVNAIGNWTIHTP
jgi:hypothetical protein